MALFPVFCNFVWMYSQFWSGSYSKISPPVNWCVIPKITGYFCPNWSGKIISTAFVPKKKSSSHICISNVLKIFPYAYIVNNGYESVFYLSQSHWYYSPDWLGIWPWISTTLNHKSMRTWHRLNIKTQLTSLWIAIIKIKLSHDRLVFIMEFP